MPAPYLGEIRMFAGKFAPEGWVFCDGQLLQISENGPLHGLLGTTYGGDGQETFGLPNLQSRIPIGQGQGPGLSNRVLAQTVGVEEVALTPQQIPGHTHTFVASTLVGGATNPGQDQVLATGTNVQFFRAIRPNLPMSSNAISIEGISQPHENLMPYLAVNYILATNGIYPALGSPPGDEPTIEPFIGEIRMFGYQSPPSGWAPCNGQIMPITQNTALFGVLGDTYGGDNKSTFALPNLEGCAALHAGQGPGLSLYRLGQSAGSSLVGLGDGQMPAHTHTMMASVQPANQMSPDPSRTFASSTGGAGYQSDTTENLAPLSRSSLTTAGGSQYHNNVQPSLPVNFCIAQQGTFPPRPPEA